MPTEQVKYKKEDWQSLADCIRSEQLSARQIFETFEDNPEFAKWYKKKYKLV